MQIPEQPFLVFPSVAKAVGLEGALLLGCYQQLANQVGLKDSQHRLVLRLGLKQLGSLISFWDEQQHLNVTEQLERRGCLLFALNGGAAEITLLNTPASATPRAEINPAPAVQSLPIVESPQRPVSPNSRAAEVANSRAASGFAPAPVSAFGGSVGWRRQKDELEMIFEQHEERNQKLHEIYIGWQPSTTFYQMLRKQGIPDQFAAESIDEFILYWIEKDRKESNWDQKFLSWVKRGWVKKQTEHGRQQRIAQDQKIANTGFNHENTRRDTRENRKRVTAAIMDIKDTDW